MTKHTLLDGLDAIIQERERATRARLTRMREKDARPLVSKPAEFLTEEERVGAMRVAERVSRRN